MNNNEITLTNTIRSNDGWTKGKATCNGRTYDFEIKHFDEGSAYGIRQGRISKLWMREEGAKMPVLSYDRAWERGFSPRGKDAEAIAIYKAILAKFN